MPPISGVANWISGRQLQKFFGRLAPDCFCPSPQFLISCSTPVLNIRTNKQLKDSCIPPAKMKAMSPKRKLHNQKTMHEKIVCPKNDWTRCGSTGGCWGDTTVTASSRTIPACSGTIYPYCLLQTNYESRSIAGSRPRKTRTRSA